MLIVTGWLRVDPDDRDAYLAGVAGVPAAARAAAGCLEFVQLADPDDAGRIIVLERWDDDASLLAFRASGSEAAAGDQQQDPDSAPDPDDLPPILYAEVRKYRISSIEDP